MILLPLANTSKKLGVERIAARETMFLRGTHNLDLGRAKGSLVEYWMGAIDTIRVLQPTLHVFPTAEDRRAGMGTTRRRHWLDFGRYIFCNLSIRLAIHHQGIYDSPRPA